MRLEPDCPYPDAQAVFKLKEDRKVIGEMRLGGIGGAQSVILGQHPDGPRYQILVNQPPLVVSLADLDELVPGLLNEPQRPATVTTYRPSTDTDNIWKRITAYLDKCDPAVAGQNGHDTLFRVLCSVIGGFDLSPERAWEAALYYSQKCDPPWSDKELRHKVDDALKATSSEPRGHLLENQNDTAFVKTLKREQAQRDAAENESIDENQTADTVISLEEETEKRLKQYLEDPEPFPASMRPEAFHGVIGEIAKLMTEHCESSPEVSSFTV